MPVPGLNKQADFESMFDPQSLDQTGDRWGHRWRGSQHFRLDLTLSVILPLLKRPAADPVITDNSSTPEWLDVGCGLSEFLNRVQQVAPFFERFGTDISANAVRWNQAQFPDNHYQQSALPESGFPGKQFDVISALEVLYYLPTTEQQSALDTLFARLRPGGLLLISGGLDQGQRYWREDWIIDAVQRRGHILAREYHYAKLFSRLEAFPVQLINALLRALEFAEQRRRTGQAEIQARPLASSVYRWLSKLLADSATANRFAKQTIGLLRRVLNTPTPARLTYGLCRRLFARRCRSHILLVVQKTV